MFGSAADHAQISTTKTGARDNEDGGDVVNLLEYEFVVAGDASLGVGLMSRDERESTHYDRGVRRARFLTFPMSNVFARKASTR